jgi:CBS domain-containing protein
VWGKPITPHPPFGHRLPWEEGSCGQGSVGRKVISMPEIGYLAAGAIFRGLDQNLLRRLIERSDRKILTDGEVIFRVGQPYAGVVFILLQGDMAVRRPDGQSYRVLPGDFLGLSSYLDDQPYGSTAAAVGSAEILVMAADTFRELQREFPELSNAVNRSIAERIRRWSPGRKATAGILVQSVRSVMTAPLATCGMQTSLQGAYALMKTRKIGSLGVTHEDGSLFGLVTHASVLEALLLQGALPEQPVARAGFEVPHTIDADAPLWQAEEIQQNKGVKYLVVLEDGAPVGMISQTNIVRGLSAHAQQNTMFRRAQEAGELSELAAIYIRMEDSAAEALEYNRRAGSAIRVLSETHLAINRRCVELTLEEMRAEGLGGPPVPYALIIMGSGGRKEMMLDPDQDNGIILADSAASASPESRAWFGDFCNRVNENMAKVGYILCPGDIMARNPMFHKTLREWKDQISKIAQFPNQKGARWSQVVFDFDTLYGEDELTVQLRRHIHKEIADLRGLLKLMVADDAEGRPPIGFFNRLITSSRESGKIDIKRNGLRIIADGARIYAVGAGIGVCNTGDRLNALVRQGVLEADLVDSTITAYEELIAMLLDHQIAQRRRGEKLDKFIDPEKLSSYLQEVLRESMLAVKRFQDRLQVDFGVVSLV